MIEVRHLTKLYGERAAVDDLSFTVQDGTIYGFLGPNGAGKTTTMNILTGYLAPTDGTVRINGYDILEEPEAAKKTIGYLPEVPPVYPDMTVYEYLEFAAAVKKIPRRERQEQIDLAVEELGLADVIDRLIRNLSKGFRQRVGFAQALLGNPKTLILDEPTVGLDPKQIIEIRALIRQLGRKHTVILSSHILSEVSEICDRVLIISHGKLVACDAPEALRAGRQGKSVLVLTVEGERERVQKAVSSVLPRENVQITEEAGTVRVRAALPDGSDIRRQVSRALLDAGCAVLEMKVETESLENIFLELTDDEGRETAEDETPERTAGEAD